MQKTPFFKRRLLVNNRLQITLVLYSLSLAISITALNLIVEYNFAAVLHELSPAAALGVLTASIGAIFLFSVILGLWITNKIAGPIYRLRNHIEAINSGQEIRPIAFRDTDYFQELLEPYNQLLKDFESRR